MPAVAVAALTPHMPIMRALLLLLVLALPAQAADLSAAVTRARALPQLHSLIVARDGEVLVRERLRGPALDRPVNVKSVSKTIIATLVGQAIARGHIRSADEPIGPLLGPLMPAGADPRAATITVGQLLSMQSGLERTSGANYGRWVNSRNWVAHVLERPMVAAPGGPMLYSTGNTHLLSAILTRATGRSTLDLARDWLGEPLDIAIAPWDRDPQGIYLGGNNMALSPLALLRFGEMIRRGGKVGDTQVVPEDWIATSWRARTASIYTGDDYGYGWFGTTMAGHAVHYAWGYGGQLLYVVPDLDLTVVMLSAADAPSGRSGYARELHDLMADLIISPLAGASLFLFCSYF